MYLIGNIKKLTYFNAYSSSAVVTAHPPTVTQQQQQQTRVMHQLASQSRDPITKAVATNIVGVQRHGQATGKEKYYFKITASVNV